MADSDHISNGSLDTHERCNDVLHLLSIHGSSEDIWNFDPAILLPGTDIVTLVAVAVFQQIDLQKLRFLIKT